MKTLYEKVLSRCEKDSEPYRAFEHSISDLYGKASDDQLEKRFLVQSTNLYEVDGSFPRITHETVSDAITKARYEINVSAVKSYLSSESIEKILSNGRT